ncbi:MAG: chemotaxis-specific protein-glutamate methyltransferase CheB [Roseburia sp.]
MKKNILIVDDSALMRRVICDIINTSSDFQVSDVCRDGLEAYEKLKVKTYDAVLLDINMPQLDGLQLLEKLKQENIKATVIIVSSLSNRDAKVTLLAIERGALDFVTKPENIIEAKGENFRSNILRVLDAVCNKPKHSAETAVRSKQTLPERKTSKAGKAHGDKLVALACSTGGPKALQQVIPFLDPNLDAPMLVVQHMPAGFTKSMSERLNELSPIRVREAQDGDVLEKGVVYVAPGGKHLRIQQTSTGKHRVVLGDEPAIGGLKPCADVMYESLKECGFGEITCVVLTGMGADGTKGIVSLSHRVPIYVIAQDASSCVVYGMPRSIAEAGMVDEIAPLDQVAKAILKNVGVSKNGRKSIS